jgi:outer membrane exchange protein TraA
VASNYWTKDKLELGLTQSDYPGKINTYMEEPVNRASRSTSVFRYLFDFSNNFKDFQGNSDGDFLNAVTGCSNVSAAGCGMFSNSPLESQRFVSRYRGYLNVTPDMVDRPLHFGFYLDDAVSFVIYDRNQKAYPVIVRPPDLGAATFRSTNTVTFENPGLFPVELVYAQIKVYGALEFSSFDGTFVDGEWTLGENNTKLSSVGFQLVTPEKFFQTETGRHSYENPDQCMQCSRFAANQPGNGGDVASGGCGNNSGYYCNAAALCALCDTFTKCGPSCSPCGLSTPNCVNVNGSFTCVECVNNAECKGVCDTTTNTCQGDCKLDTDCAKGICDQTDHTCKGECRVDTDCAKGICDQTNHMCKGDCRVDADCPNGRCDPTDNMCRGCNDDADCPNGRCDMTDNVCRGCNDDGDCPNTGRCDTTVNLCAGCNDDGDCRTQGFEGFVCDIPNSVCVQCTEDDHCANGRVCVPGLRECRECSTDANCPRGESCSNFQCTTCSTNDSCAGASCNCCPKGTQCASPTPGASPSCVECTNNSQCPSGKTCDTANGRCVDSIPECNTSDRCGPGCVRCPEERPLCLDGQVCVQCRTDLECGQGKYCLSGECSSCTTDRHCGTRCGACEKDAPYCLSNGTAEGSACVQCRDNSDCGGRTCNLTTHTCENSGACAVSCGPGLVCNGSACVQCFADAHCPCGGTCDTASNTCSSSCEDSEDCLGVQHCSPNTQLCERGRRKPGVTPQGGGFCCGTPADLTPVGTIAALAMLSVALLLRPRRSR